MANRTPRELWGKLFNFAGDGIVHLELFEEFLSLMAGPTQLELVAAYLLLRGTHAARPSVTTLPEGAEYYETDTGSRFKAVAGAWVADSEAGSGSPSVLTLVSAVTVTTATDTITFSGLDGDADGQYQIIARITNDAASAVAYTLRPNNTTSDQRGKNNFFTTVTDGANSTTLMNFADIEAGFSADIDLRFNPATGAPRTGYDHTVGAWTSSGLQTIGFQYFFVWDEDTTNITSIILHANDAVGFGVGSKIKLYKLTE